MRSPWLTPLKLRLVRPVRSSDHALFTPAWRRLVVAVDGIANILHRETLGMIAGTRTLQRICERAKR
jgi:hypothetical protein